MTIVERNGFKCDTVKWDATQRRAMDKQLAKRRARVEVTVKAGRTTVRRAPVKPVSDKRREEKKVYDVRRVVFLEAHPVCEFPKGCHERATTVHHLQGRVGDLYLDESKWVPACLTHNLWSDDHPVESKAIGWSLPRVGWVA